MTKSTIGTVSFFSTKGNPDPLGTQDEEITPNWTDGHSFREVGKKSAPFTIQTFSDYTSASNRATAFNNLKALEGTIVTWYDDDGTSWSNVKIVKVRMAHKSKVLRAVGGLANGSYLLRCDVEAQIVA